MMVQNPGRGSEHPAGRLHRPEITPPGKIFGRDREMGIIRDIFERVSGGNIVFLLISGYAGIGKSALIETANREIFQQKCRYIYGKFEEFKKNVPYNAIVQAFRGFIEQLLTKSRSELRQWKERLIQALAPNAQAIINVIPALEAIVGKQPQLTQLGPLESQNRFRLYFQKFINVFSGKASPLVMVLDDLQWADLASLTLLKALVSNKEIHNLLVIGAYRDNEIDSGHPLMLVLEEIKKEKIAAHNIWLGPLKITNVGQIIKEILGEDNRRVMSLAEVVFNKTNGNPFFINEFLKSIYRDKILQPGAEPGENWRIDLESLHQLQVTDNVADLLVMKIKKYLIGSQELIKLAACIGTQFSLELLSLACEKSKQKTFSAFTPIIQEGLLFYVNGNYCFIHDKIQETVYSFIPEEEKKATHYKIGSLLLEHTPKSELKNKVFFITDQLNAGREKITEGKRRTELLNLNLLASKTAREAAAYESALKYLVIGIDLLEEGSWSSRYGETLALFTRAVEAAYLCADFVRMERYAKIVLREAKNLLDKVKIYEIIIKSYIAQNKLMEAVTLGREVLKQLGVILPKKPTKADILFNFIKIKFALRGKTVADLKDLPDMKDQYKLAAIRIMISTGSAAYYSLPNLPPIMIFRILELSLKYGNTPSSAFCYAAYGFVLCGIIGASQAGYEYGRVAVDLVRQKKAREQYAKVYFMFNVFIRPFREHMEKTVESLRQAYTYGLESGDFEYAVNCITMYFILSYFIGKNLLALNDQFVHYYNSIIKFKQQRLLHTIRKDRQFALNLMGKSEYRIKMKGESFDEDEMLPVFRAANDRINLNSFYLYRSILAYLFYEYREAKKNIEMAESYMDAGLGSLNNPQYWLYDSLILSALYTQVSVWKKLKFHRQIVSNRNKLKKPALSSPQNGLHKYRLIEAELARIGNKPDTAIKKYDAAIQAARENRYKNEEALADELKALFLLSENKRNDAAVYFQAAHRCYSEWGALAKVRHLEERFPAFFTGPTIQNDAG